MSTNPTVPDHSANQPGPEVFRGRTLTVSLTVKDLRKSLAWYQDVVGFDVDRRIEREGVLRGVVLKAGQIRLSINQDDGAKGWDRVKGEGFSLRVATDQSIDETAKRIRASGGILDSEPADMPWGTRMFRLRDPDGYRISISSMPAA